MNSKLPPFIDPSSILSVEKLNHIINQTLQAEFPTVYVEGEISNLIKPASGHYYFTLKDDNSQIKCALFSGFRKFIKVKLENGLKILVKAKISIYIPRGDYQLIVEHAYPTGLGALQQAFEELKKKLHLEGLFEADHKKPIPKLPKQIFVITSATGAAIRDILITIKNRFPTIPIKIIPTLVQGESAAASIIKAIKTSDKLSNHKTDVIILARGGGSLEDLWCFNDELLARTIFHCKTPIITGIGHEIDFTIADFVADLRAATPTAAAQAATAHWQEYYNHLITLQNNLIRALNNYLELFCKSIQYLNHRLHQQHPETKILSQMQQLDEISNKLNYIWHNGFNFYNSKFHFFNNKIINNSPLNKIKLDLSKIIYFKKNLTKQITHLLNNSENILINKAQQLNSVNPLEILARGYSVITNQNQTVIKHSTEVKAGDKLTARLYDGTIECEVL